MGFVLVIRLLFLLMSRRDVMKFVEVVWLNSIWYWRLGGSGWMFRWWSFFIVFFRDRLSSLRLLLRLWIMVVSIFLEDFLVFCYVLS